MESLVQAPTTAPIADWVDPQEMLRDPYPTYRRLRAESPVAYVPKLDRYFVTTFQDAFDVEMDQETFSSHEAGEKSPMVRALGRPMLRLDDPEHKVERNAISPAMRPVAIKRFWRGIFEQNAAKYLGQLRDAGPGSDLFTLFAVPYAADNLSAIIGLRDIPATQMMDWSHTFIAGISNVTNDPAVWRETDRVSAEIDEAIDEAIVRLSKEPDASMISAMLKSGLSDERLRPNIKLTISGGMNEPSHVISSAVWSLSQFPEQRARVLADDGLWKHVFEETARFMSPVGMMPRTATKDTVVGGVRIPAGARIAVSAASANHDERKFESPDEFKIDRDDTAHIAFGNGTHVCAGNWIARSMVGDHALPLLYKELPGLRVIDPEHTDFYGWVFRGPRALPVEWDA